MKAYEASKAAKMLELDKILASLAEQTVTADAGEEALALTPVTEAEEVARLLVNTADAYAFLARTSSPSFGHAKNMAPALRRAQAMATLSIPELLDIAETLRVIRGLKAWRDGAESKHATSIDGLFAELMPNPYLEEKITFAIQSEDELNDHASPALYDIRRKIVAKESRVRESLEKLVRGQTAKYLQEAIITQRDGRFVVPVKAEHRAQIGGIVHDTSSTGSTVFIEPMAVVEAGNEIRVLKLKEKEEIDRILAELSAEAGNFAEGILASYAALVRLDLIFAKAKLAYRMKAVLPQINAEGITVLKRARHPLIPAKEVVPVTVELGGEYDTLVITGPNTGGKTVTLKTVGLLTLMTMCGLMIPADDGSRVAIYRRVFADIGDEQSIEQSLSTFSSHMVNIISITRLADDRSLVLFDELCAGTDPIEGAALAKAILMHLHAAGAKIVATTHYPELKSYAIDTPRVENASCEFDVTTLKPTYRLIVGTPGRSNAFAISGRLGLDGEIIRTAKAEVSDQDLRFERVVASLESARRHAEKEHEKARRLRQELSAAEQAAAEREKEWENKREKVMEQTRKTADAILENARAQSSRLLNELEEMKKQMSAENAAKTAQKARESFKRSMEELEKSADPVMKRAAVGSPVEVLHPGDVVLIADLRKEATVLEVKEKEKKAYVLSGAMKMWVPFGDLRYQKSAPKTEEKKTRRITGLMSRGQREVSGELDLRGMAADEAVLELDRYIDNAVLSGISSVRIIHGKGTGVLRQAVQAHLRSHPHIKQYRLGTFGEGENGVTIAELAE